MSGKDDETGGAIPPVSGEPTARFGPSEAPRINLQVNAQTLHINPSNFSALERIVQINPEVASQLIQVSRDAVKYERDRYKVGAISSVVICCCLLFCSAAVAIASSFWSGIAFFLSCVVVAAIVAAIFTGKIQDLSWTVGAITRAAKDGKKQDTPDNQKD